MLALKKPTPARLDQNMAALGELALTPGKRGRRGSIDEAIGWGLKRFERATHALKRLEQFNVPGTHITPQIRATEGARTMVVGRRLGLWTVGPMAVTSVTESETTLTIEVTTLEGHPLAGTERFELERQPNGIVRLRIHATSTPTAWWARLGLPVVRWMQRSYRKDALDHMRQVTGRPSIDR